MSNIYIQEPPTLGKVLLVTSAGEIDVELWSKEAPKACRNFVQLCMEGYYNGTVFHRVVKDFIAQGGDPTGTGEGGESIYGEPFKDEIHSRLRFNRRGLLAMANAGRDDNGSQFFFTLAATPELQGKHTIFAKVVGDTIYNMIKLDGETDENERPLHCHKIVRTEILNNPFTDIIPRAKATKKKREKREEKKQGVKNFKLLSFGEEAEEDEEETKEISKHSKIKSSHDLLNDPKLSSELAIAKTDALHLSSSDSEERDALEAQEPTEREDPEDEYYLGKSKEDELLKKRTEIQKEIQQLKDDYKNRNKKPKPVSQKAESSRSEEIIEEKDNELVEEYKTNLVKYGELKTKLPLKGSERESFTMKMLSKFKNKLKEVKETVTEVDDEEYNEADSENWMAHTLKFEVRDPVLARDANTKTDDWYDITDPRNPINKRRREESKKEMQKHAKRTRD